MRTNTRPVVLKPDSMQSVQKSLDAAIGCIGHEFTEWEWLGYYCHPNLHLLRRQCLNCDFTNCTVQTVLDDE